MSEQLRRAFLRDDAGPDWQDAPWMIHVHERFSDPLKFVTVIYRRVRLSGKLYEEYVTSDFHATADAAVDDAKLRLFACLGFDGYANAREDGSR